MPWRPLNWFGIYDVEAGTAMEGMKTTVAQKGGLPFNALVAPQDDGQW